ncbi:MAG: hypothetical protein ACR2HF_06230 [Methylococcaceae bacterium]
MQAIEFETMALHQTIRLPKGIPDGVNLRVLILVDDSPSPTTAKGSTSQEPRHPAPHRLPDPSP